MIIIAFSGKSGHGKSTLADMLVKRLGATKLSFAQLLREDAVVAGYPEELLYKKPTDTIVRSYLIAAGKLRRLVDPDYYVRGLCTKIISFVEHSDFPPNLVVVDDMRYENEAEILTALMWGDYGIPVILVRLVTEDATEVEFKNEESETALDKYKNFDTTITIKMGELEEAYAALLCAVDLWNYSYDPA